MALLSLGCSHLELRKFPDRPVAWDEHDDQHVSAAPERNGWWNKVRTVEIQAVVRVGLRHLTVPQPTAALDVNALDEVPCSTWFCPRNHLQPLSPAEVAAGPPGFSPPAPPFTIVEGKTGGATPGLVVDDSRGVRYLLKLDPPGQVALASGAEVVGTRLLHAAGYHVPGAYMVRFTEEDLTLDPEATYDRHGYEERRLDWPQVAAILAAGGRDASGKLRAAAVAWLPGRILGGFDYRGRRADDPNDRIPHEHRRSLRATYVLFGWLNVSDAGPGNTLDSYVEEGERRFVRHYLIDFGTSLGSLAVTAKLPPNGAEHLFEVTRILRAWLTLGIYRRDWQGRDAEWREEVRLHPATGWLPTEGWAPDEFRTTSPIPAHQWMTARDAYWGAKVVTSFTDAQIAAAVAEAGYPRHEARRLAEAIILRRDAVGRHYLTRVTAVEDPVVDGDGRLCFRDLALERRAARAVVYQLRVLGGDGEERSRRHVRGAPRLCVSLAPRPRPYLVAELRAQVDGRLARAARVHLAFRPDEKRFVVVGLEREE